MRLARKYDTTWPARSHDVFRREVRATTAILTRMMPQTRSMSTTNPSRNSNTGNTQADQWSPAQPSQSSESHPPKPLSRASTTFYDRIITDWWWWELVSWLVSFSCFMAIVGILLYYDGKKQPSHVFKGITLNAFISILSAIAKAAMILPVSECIGQLKWLWFKEERRLSDFLAFDNASRGPWGSLVLLGTTMCRSVVVSYDLLSSCTDHFTGG
jgi:hypothetical protein